MSASDQDRLSRDEVYDILSNARRRFTISFLREQGGQVTLGDLSDRVAAWENDTNVDDLTQQQVKRVYVSLYQTHIPKLEEAGIVEYDSDSGVVRLTSSVSDLEAYLPEEEEERDVPWERIYLALAFVGLLTYGAAAAAGEAVQPAVLTAIGFVIFLAFGLVVIAQYVYERRS